MRLFNILSAVLLLLNINISLAQNSTNSHIKKIYTTNRTSSDLAPLIDGKLDDPVWNTVAWGKDFIETEPDENTPPSLQSQYKIVYDEKYLYVGIRAFDKAPDSIVKRLSRRDGFVGDRIFIAIDSNNDKRTAFGLSITAAGVKGDAFILDNGNSTDDSWNPIWYTKAIIDEKGWSTEMKIPFSQLRFGKDIKQTWGINFVRTIFRYNERSAWNRIPIDAPGWISEMGELRGLLDIKPQKQLEIQPFSISQFDSYPSELGNPFRDGSDLKFKVGLDAKIGITNDLTLDLTINPDFGQVEADPGAIALDGFQIFFNERRPFFVENKNIFDFQFASGFDNLFYSRRVGRSPQGKISLGGGNFLKSEAGTTILGAAKFSGKTKNGWSLGLLESITSREIVDIDDGTGNRREAIVEPFTNYLVARAQKDFNNRKSFIGLIFTATNRKLGDSFSFGYDQNSNQYTDDETGQSIDPFSINNRENNLNLLHKSAYTAGIDFNHQWLNRKYYFVGNMVFSHINGSKEAIAFTQNTLTHLFNRIDADHVEVDPNRTSLNGTGGKLEFGKSGVGNWRYGSGLIWRSPELELNDLGFLRQADDIRQYNWIDWRNLKPFGIFRNINPRMDVFTAYDFEGNYNRIQYEINTNAVFLNNWTSSIQLGHKPRIFTNTFLRGGPRWRFSEENFLTFSLGTDKRKKLNVQFDYLNSQGKQRSFTFLNYVLQLNYQPSDALNLSLTNDYFINKNRTQYVTANQFENSPRYILADIDQRTFSTTLRVNYSINPNLSIQYYGQPFISRGRYKDFNHVNNSLAKDLNERVSFLNDNQINYNQQANVYDIDENNDESIDYTIGNPDFAVVQFRSNLVARWEYIPGSEIFLVWSQGINGLGNAADGLFESLEKQLLRVQPNNTFLIKVTYRFRK